MLWISTTYFNKLAEAMKKNPPSADDAPMVANMAKIGFVPGQDFDPSKLGAFDKEAIKAVPKPASGEDHGIREES